MSRAKVRALAAASAALSLAASFVFSIAVTRKLPFIYLGLLNVYAGAISISSVATSVVGFMSPRLSARDKGIAVGLIWASVAVGLAGSAVAAAFMFGLRWRITEYFYLMTALASASAVLVSVGSAFSGGLAVYSRERLMYSSLVTSAVKLLSVYFIYLEKWSFESVLVANFLILASGVAYSAVAAVGLFRPGAALKSLREVMAGTWVALIGYASGNIRSLDSFMIAELGGVEDNAAWQVLGVAGGIYAFRTQLMRVMYGEMLQGESSERRAYYDLLLTLFFTALASVFIVLFEPSVVEFLRPSDRYLISLMWTPFALWASATVFSTLNRYLNIVMQGVERRDLEGELTAKTYLGTLVLYANVAELALTASYVALIPAFVLALRSTGAYFYVLDGVILASVAATAVSLAVQLLAFPQARSYVNPRGLLRDFLIPLLLSVLVLYPMSGFLESMFPPTTSALVGLLRLAALGAITAAVYGLLSLAVSESFRRILRLALRSLRRLTS